MKTDKEIVEELEKKFGLHDLQYQSELTEVQDWLLTTLKEVREDERERCVELLFDYLADINIDTNRAELLEILTPPNN